MFWEAHSEAPKGRHTPLAHSSLLEMLQVSEILLAENITAKKREENRKDGREKKGRKKEARQDRGERPFLLLGKKCILTEDKGVREK